MKNSTQQSTYTNFLDFMQQPMVKGSVLGGGVMFWVTPGVNSFAHRANNTRMPWAQMFTGWQPLVVSGIVGTATSFTVKKYLLGNQRDSSSFHLFWTSATAGALSGVVLCPFECLAQNRQLSATRSLRNTGQSIFQHHGYAGFFRGTVAMMAREGAWVPMYLTAVPLISQRMQQAGYNRGIADAVALIVSASLFGIFSTPINRLRVMKQSNLTIAGRSSSYRQLASTMLHEHAEKTMPRKIADCFKGAGVRSLTSGWAGGLFYYGGEAYDAVIPKIESKP